jgi:hypothetical protein
MLLFNEIGQNQTEQVANYIDKDLTPNCGARHGVSMQMPSGNWHAFW